MPRMLELKLSLPRIGNRDSAPDQDRLEIPSRARSTEERREELERYVESDEFAADNARVAELLLKGDEKRLVEFGSEDSYPVLAVLSDQHVGRVDLGNFGNAIPTFPAMIFG